VQAKENIGHPTQVRRRANRSDLRPVAASEVRYGEHEVRPDRFPVANTNTADGAQFAYTRFVFASVTCLRSITRLRTISARPIPHNGMDAGSGVSVA